MPRASKASSVGFDGGIELAALEKVAAIARRERREHGRLPIRDGSRVARARRDPGARRRPRRARVRSASRCRRRSTCACEPRRARRGLRPRAPRQRSARYRRTACRPGCSPAVRRAALKTPGRRSPRAASRSSSSVSSLSSVSEAPAISSDGAVLADVVARRSRARALCCAALPCDRARRARSVGVPPRPLIISATRSPVLERQVRRHGVEHLVDDGVGGLQLVAAAARLAVDADADFHLVVADARRSACPSPAACRRVSATPIVRTFALTFVAIA